MIHSFAYAKDKIGDLGRVVAIRNSIVWVDGLSGAGLGEVVSFADDRNGLVMGLDKDRVEIAVFSNQPMQIGDQVARTGETLHVSVGDEIVGSVVDALGYTVAGGKDLSPNSASREVFVQAQSIVNRQIIEDFFTTGTILVDLLTPLGKGQRELVLGDRQVGKTYYSLRTIITQAKMGVVCVIALIGKQKKEIRHVIEVLKQEGVFEQCVIVAANAQASLGEIYVAPYTAMAIAEHFRDRGQETLVVLDDLTTHATFYREMALLTNRFPGRDSYPGDIFYIHSSLLERAGNFKVGKKTVAITCLPLAELSSGDMTGYIQTNLMSMTDGHIYFDHDLFLKGRRPSINVFLSITRVGHQTQTPLMRDVEVQIMSAMQQAEHLQRFLRFGAEVTDHAHETLSLVEQLWRLFAQSDYQSYPIDVQLILLACAFDGRADLRQEASLVKYLHNAKVLAKASEIVKQSKTLKELISNSKSLRQQLYAVASGN